MTFDRMTTRVLVGMALVALAGCGGSGGGEQAVEAPPPAISTHASEPAEVSWAPSWQDALERASEQDQAVLVTFYADWCIWCTRFETTTMTDRDVSGFVAANLVPVRLDVEAEGRGLSREFRVNGLPTLVLVDASGSEISRAEGYLPPGEFLKWVRASLA